jgi:hypothetical protein
LSNIHGGSEDRKNYKTQCGDGESSDIKKAETEKRGIYMRRFLM